MTNTILNTMALKFFDLDELIVQHSLSALGKLPKKRDVFVAGGIATQLYNLDKRELLRPTSDIDLPDISNEDFKEFVAGKGNELKEILEKEGYKVQLKRGHYSNNVLVRKDSELFSLNFTRYNKELHDKTAHITKREYENSSSINLPWNTTQKLKIIRPEDILANKSKRVSSADESIISKEGILYSIFLDYAKNGDFKHLEMPEWDLKKWCKKLTSKQNELNALDLPENGLEKTEAFQSYKLNKDLYDLSLMSNFIFKNPSKFNRAYFDQAKSELMYDRG